MYVLFQEKSIGEMNFTVDEDMIVNIIKNPNDFIIYECATFDEEAYNLADYYYSEYPIDTPMQAYSILISCIEDTKKKNEEDADDECF